MLEMKLTVSDPGQIAAILALITGGTTAPAIGAKEAASPEPPQPAKEKKAKEKVTDMPAAKEEAAPSVGTPPTNADSPADIRKRLTPKVVQLASTPEGAAKIRALLAAAGAARLSLVPDDKLAAFEAGL